MNRSALLFAIPLILASAAWGATIPIPITGGSFSLNGLGWPFGNQDAYPYFNLTTTTGTLTGWTPAYYYDRWWWNYSGTAPITISPLLGLETGDVYAGSRATNLVLTTPDPVRIYDNGSSSGSVDRVYGNFSGSVTLNVASLPSSFTLYAPFSGQIELMDYSEPPWSNSNPYVLLNDYLLSGSGVAQLNFSNQCTLGNGCMVVLNSATYVFTPEPRPVYFYWMIALLGCGCRFYHRCRSRSLQ